MTWVALELTKAGEAKAIEGSLADSLRSGLGVQDDYPIFVPYVNYSKGGRRVSIRLIEGYAFAASGLTETRYFALERGPFVSRVMSTSGPHNMRTLQTVADEKIRGMMDQLRSQVSSDIEVGAKVKVIGGNYLHLEGEVVDLMEEKAAVRIRLRSLDVVAWIPKILVDSGSNSSEDSSSELDPLDVAVGPEFLPED
jgi:transcription antitermination factor NusG